MADRYSWRAPNITAEEQAKVDADIAQREELEPEEAESSNCGRIQKPCCGGSCGR